MSILEQQLKSVTRSLRFVLVMSMIGSGYMLLNSLFMSAFLPLFKEFVTAGLSSLPTEFKAAYELALSIPRICYVLMTILYALSLTGVIMMWRLRQNGWHCYTLAQLLLLVVPVLFMGKAYLALGDVMMAILFVGFYFVVLKEIRKLNELIADSSNKDSNNEITPSEDSQDQSE